MNPDFKTPPPPGWMRNIFKKRREPWFIDGDTFIIAVRVKNISTKEESWQIDHVRADCDGERFQLVHPGGEPYDDWTWSDVDYYIPIDAVGPMTEKQIEAYL